MGEEKYVYDKDGVRFRKERISVRKIVKRCLTFFLASVSVAVIYYVILALIFNTDIERRLKRENRMLEASSILFSRFRRRSISVLKISARIT